jgi:hypothetical protein
MSPPTEQLIRDYLKRLSLAARGQLGPDDLRALVDRARELIEQQTNGAGPPTTMEVGTLLAGLGDPSRLVEQERERLTALRGEPPEPEAIRARFPRTLHRDPARARTASWHWPRPEGNRSDRLLTLLGNGAPVDDRSDAAPSASAKSSAAETSTTDSSTAETSSAETGAAGPWDVNGTARNGLPRNNATAGPDEPTARIPAQGGEPSWFMLALGGRGLRTTRQQPESADTAPSASPDSPRWPSAVPRDTSPDERAASSSDSGSSSASPVWQLTKPREPVLPKPVRLALDAGAAWYRRGPLAAWAVILLGLGGVIYPPVWLVGAVIALASRTWDLRDKGIGLGLPLLLTLIGTAIGVAGGGHVSGGQGVHEGWVYGVAASRIAAVLSACYLGWRRAHERRPPAVPPWNRTRKIG